MHSLHMTEQFFSHSANDFFHKFIFCSLNKLRDRQKHLRPVFPPNPARADCPKGVPAEACKPPWAALPVRRPPNPASA